MPTRKNAWNNGKPLSTEPRNMALLTVSFEDDQTCNAFCSVEQAAKDNQAQAVRQSRPEEKDYSGYHTVHNLEIPNLSVTVSVHCLCSSSGWIAFRLSLDPSYKSKVHRSIYSTNNDSWHWPPRSMDLFRNISPPFILYFPVNKLNRTNRSVCSSSNYIIIIIWTARIFIQ